MMILVVVPHSKDVPTSQRSEHLHLVHFDRLFISTKVFAIVRLVPSPYEVEERGDGSVTQGDRVDRIVQD